MATTKVMKEETTAIPRLSLVDDTEIEWLTEELKHDIREGLAIVTKIDSGEEFTSWNNWVVQVVSAIPELKGHLTIRKTKKGVKYYGMDRKIWALVKDEQSVDGLPAL